MRATEAIVALLLALSLGAMRAEAETFDCGQPTSPLARLICNDPVLRAADAEENEIYDTALSASLDRSALREEERNWFTAEILPYNWFAQQHAPIDHTKVVEAYRQRDEALRREAQLWRKSRRPLPGTILANTCLALPQRSGNCSVADFAPIAGAPSLKYQQQAYAPEATSVIVIFAAVPEHPDQWLPLAAAASAHAALTPPQAIASPAGTLLLIASADSATSALYRLDKDALEDIDDRSWLETLPSRLPDGLALAPEIVADYRKMAAVATVARSQSSCCRAGSTATITLAIENQRVVVRGVTFGEPEGSPSHDGN